MAESLTGKEPGREQKVKQYRTHMVGLRTAIKAVGNLTLEEAGDENIAADLIARKNQYEHAAGVIRRDLKLRTPPRLKV